MNDTNGTDGIVCREDFVKTDLLCEPRCDSFKGSSHSESFYFYSEVIATSISLTLCTVAIIVAVKEYKTLLVTIQSITSHNIISLYHYRLVYPSVLVLFQIIDMTVLGKVHYVHCIHVHPFIGIVLIVTAIYRYKLYCGSVSLLETLENPTPFCKFSGKI